MAEPLPEHQAASSLQHPAALEAHTFRDSIPTVDEGGKRVWVYPKKPSGKFYRWRTWVSWFLLAIMIIGPFIRINGNPLLLMNIVERKFSIFGMMFWPQDMYLFALAMITGFFILVLFTAVFGRVWCGWLCPQTVLMEMVFRKIEYWIEGDGQQQRSLGKAPWGPVKIRKKVTKHLVFFALSFLISNWLLAYIIGSEALIEIITDPPGEHTKGLAFMALFALFFYGIFARFREQACTFVCPYGRFQSVLLDENTIVVAYDSKRGEPQGKLRKTESHAERVAGGLGDCIGCKACVRVCPTGIDIRNGTQMECINCTACIDACDDIMDKSGFEPGLIRYASMNQIQKGEKFKVTPRLIGYVVILTVLLSTLTFFLVGRSDIDVMLLRAPGTLYQERPDGTISNLYLLKLTNKSREDIPVSFRLENLEGKITVAGGTLMARNRQLSESAVIVELDPAAISGKQIPLEIGLYANDKLLRRLKTNFLAPRRKAP